MAHPFFHIRQSVAMLNQNRQEMLSNSIGFICLSMIVAYLVGSIPFGLILTRQFSSVDVLTSGSGNIGATNVKRVAGNSLGLLTLILDGLKGTVPVLAADTVFSATTGNSEWNELAVVTTALAAFGGHLYPVYMKFRNGGKGVATAFGCLLVIAPKAAGFCMLAYLTGILISQKSSVGSLLAAVFLPVTIGFFKPSLTMIMGGAFMAVMIFIRHRENIHRLINGTEPSVFMSRRP